MASPIVSIGMPVFNGADYIHRSLGSLLAQDYDDFEIIISDNASTDQTEEICRQFVREDNRIRYVRNQTNLGAARNYNNVFHLARGRFFKWAAHDDECHPAMIRRCVETLDNAPPFVVMVYPLAELIDGQGARVCAPLDHIEVKDPRPHRRLGRLLWSLSMCDPVFGVIKTEYLRQTQLIGPFFGADYVLLAELAMLGQIWELNEILFRLRAHPKRSMQANANSRTRTAWYDPAAARKLFVLPGWEQMVLELLKSVRHSSLPPTQKFMCSFVVPATHYWRRFRNAGGRVKRRLKARWTQFG
jgi:glycosyltransferase involved in cell wall biosynthesis